MAKRIYTENDLIEQDIETAPNLDLSAFVLEKFKMPRDGGKLMIFYVNVRKDWLPEEGCPYCGDSDNLIWSGRNSPRRIRDITRNNHCIQIITQSPRMYCTKCNQRFTPKIDGVVQDGTMTERLVDYIKSESFLQPHSVLEARTGVSIQTIQNIMDKEIEKYEQMRAANPLEAPKVLGIDEKHINHKMRGTIVDVENGLLLDMLEGNDKDSFTKAIKSLKDWDKNIKVVTTDMANSYLSWMPALLPNATFVIDKFHVIQDVNRKVSVSKKWLYEYRKNLIKNLPDGLEKEKQREILKIINDNKRLFNYSTKSLEKKDGLKAKKLATVIAKFPEFALLRTLYQYIELLYEQETREDAERVWKEWQELLPPSTEKAYKAWCSKYDISPKCFEGFKSLTRNGFKIFKPYILNYFNPGCQFTNATTEGLNNLIGVINSSGNGYHFKHLRAKALYASLIHERITFGIDMNTIKSWKPSTGFIVNPSVDSGTYEYIEKYEFHSCIETCEIPSINALTENIEFVYRLASDKECVEISDFNFEDDTSIPTTLEGFLRQFSKK